jgi:hypothetical protein
MYKFSLSVRAYHTARRYGLPDFEEWTTLPADTMREACRKAADSVFANKRGYRTAIELYRAAGLGVYNIGLIMCGDGVDIGKVRMVCGQVDQWLHESLN